VNASPLRQQRPLHLLPNRDRLHALRQLTLRLGHPQLAYGPTDSAARHIWTTGSSTPAYSLTWTHCGASIPSTDLPREATSICLATMPVGETQPPKKLITYICPACSGLQKPTGTNPRGLSYPTSSESYANYRTVLARQTVVTTAERTFRRTNYVPPSRDLFFPGERGAYEGVGPPGWSVPAFHRPYRPRSTDHAELSTQPRPPGRPRPYPDTSGHPRTRTTPPH
jgi:hypothetical protein